MVPSRSSPMVDGDSFEDLLSRDFRWPSGADKPFVSSCDVDRDSIIERRPEGRIIIMIDGYKKAGDLLVEQTVENQHWRDALLYPAIFTYRQFIELSLKYLIATYGGTVGVAPNWKDHDLQTLWEAF